MGNLISSACPAINPTFDLEWKDGDLIIKTENFATYDFEELKYKSYEEAEKAKQKILKNQF